MKIIRLEVNKVYEPFPKSVMLISEFPFLPRVSATWTYYALNGNKWLYVEHRDKLQKALILIACPSMPMDDIDEDDERYDYRKRTYRFSLENGRYELN